MTMPHLMNCSHQGEGWCLDCVKQLQQEVEKIQVECVSYATAAKEAEEQLTTAHTAIVARDYDLKLVRIGLEVIAKGDYDFGEEFTGDEAEYVANQLIVGVDAALQSTPEAAKELVKDRDRLDKADHACSSVIDSGNIGTAIFHGKDGVQTMRQAIDSL